MQIHSLSCPNCGASLEARPGDTALDCPYCGSSLRITGDGKASAFFPAAGTPVSQPPAVDAAEVLRLLAAKQKIMAVKYVRDHSPLGLKEAKDYVEALERGERPPAPPARPDPQPPVGNLDWNHIRGLLLAGNKLAAIQYVHQQTGESLNAAQETVDAYEAGLVGLSMQAQPGGLDWEPIRILAAHGRKLEAVKLYRTRTGASLEEAVKVIEAMPEYRHAPAAARGGSGCARYTLIAVLIMFAFFAACGLYVQTTGMHACAIETITADSTVREELGDPIDASIPIVFGYSSSSDFGGNSERQAGYYTLLTGPRGRALFYVNAYSDSYGSFGVRANPVPNPNDFFVDVFFSSTDGCAP
jgi:ribosomal protein L7/L12